MHPERNEGTTINKKSKEITTEEIKKIIMKSGYLLEIDVADMLRKDGWLVFSQYPYRDQKENKTRLVDILAMKHVRKKVGVSLLIECKKATRHGWAFSTIGKSEVEARAREGNMVSLWGSVATRMDRS